MEFYTAGLSANEESCYWQGFAQGKLIGEIFRRIGALKALAGREGGRYAVKLLTIIGVGDKAFSHLTSTFLPSSTLQECL